MSAIDITITSSDYTYTGSGAANEVGTDQFEIGASGTLQVTTGNSNVDGTYSNVPYSDGGNLIPATLNTDGTISFGSGDGIFAGSPCSVGQFFTNSATLAPSSAGAGIAVDPAITPSTTLTSILLLDTYLKKITTNLDKRISDILRGINPGLQRVGDGVMLNTGSGANAGDLPLAFGAWASYSYSDYDNDLSSTAFDGHTHTILAGVDYFPWDSAVLGIALGYENSDIDTTFNQGNQDTDGITIAPYFGWLLNEFLSIDASIGWSWLDNDQFRIAPGTTARITSAPDGDRWFGVVNLNGVTTWGNWILGGRTGFLLAKNTTDAFVESDGTVVSEVKNKLGQWNIGGDIAYHLGGWEPFARLTYEHDFQQTEITVIGGGPQPSNDDDSFVVGAGIRYFNANGWTGNLEWNKRLGREDFDEDTVLLTIRGEF